MWGTEYVEPHPGNIRGMSRSVTGRPSVTFQMLQIEIFQHRGQPLSQSVTVGSNFGRQMLQIEIFSSPVVKRLNL